MSAIDHQQQALKQLRGARTSIDNAQRAGADVEELRRAIDALANLLAIQVRRERLARLRETTSEAPA